MTPIQAAALVAAGLAAVVACLLIRCARRAQEHGYCGGSGSGSDSDEKSASEEETGTTVDDSKEESSSAVDDCALCKGAAEPLLADTASGAQGGAAKEVRAWCAGSAEGLAVLLDRVKAKLQNLQLYYLPNDYQLIGSLLLTSALYYADIFTDLYSIITFVQKGKPGYAASILLSVAVAHVVALTRSQATEAEGGVLMPARLVWRAVQVVRTPPSELDAEVWQTSHYDLAGGAFGKLLGIEHSLVQLMAGEAGIEAPVSSLVQIYALLHDKDLGDARASLRLSAILSVLSLAKALAELDKKGRILKTVKTRHGTAFNYVMGTGSMMQWVPMVLFRLVELSSRLMCLALFQEALRRRFHGEEWPRLAMLAVLTFSAALQAVLTLRTHPWHLADCFAGAFAFPGPLLQPPTVKIGATCALTHYALRLIETVALWAVMLHCFGWDSDKALDTLPRARYAAAAAAAFSAAVPLYLLWASRRDPQEIRLALAGELEVDDSGKLLWPHTDDPRTNPTPILQALGLGGPGAASGGAGASATGRQEEVGDVVAADPRKSREQQDIFRYSNQSPEELADELATKGQSLKVVEFFKEERLEAATWLRLLEALAGSAVESVDFHRCDLRGTKVAAVAAGLRGLRGRLKSVGFGWNRRLDAADWSCLLGTLAGGAVEHISFDRCGLRGKKARAVATGLRELKSLKSVDLGDNEDLKAEDVAHLLGALSGPQRAEEATAAKGSSLNDMELGCVECAEASGAGALSRDVFERITLPMSAFRGSALDTTLGWMSSMRGSLSYVAVSGDVDLQVWAQLCAAYAGPEERGVLRVHTSSQATKPAPPRVPLGSKARHVLRAEEVPLVVLEQMPRVKQVVLFPKTGGAAHVGTLRRLALGPLRELRIRRIHMEDEEWRCLMKALHGGAMEKISLRWCGLSGKSAVHLKEALQDLRGSLRSLDLEGNWELGPGDWRGLLGALQGGVAEEISFRDCGLQDDKAAAIAVGLEALRDSLKWLDLRSNADYSEWSNVGFRKILPQDLVQNLEIVEA